MSAQYNLQSALTAQAKNGPVSLTLLDESLRYSLRADPQNSVAMSKAFGVTLPLDIGARANSGGRHALCVGPDEWVLHASPDEAEEISQAFAAEYDNVPHSLVDISDRDITIDMRGEAALTLLTTGFPADPAQTPPGSGARTIFDTVPVVLMCEADDHYRMEVWRSFLPHVWGLLNTANAELASGL